MLWQGVVLNACQKEKPRCTAHPRAVRAGFMFGICTLFWYSGCQGRS